MRKGLLQGVVIGVVITVVAMLGMDFADTAGANTHVVIQFHNPSYEPGYVTLQIPNPPCRTTTTTPRCEWALFVNEPDNGGKIVGWVFGTSGTLSVPYPAGFCGLLQADASVGPPYRREVGHRVMVNTCECP
jgi:hypothetical protein